MSRTGATGPLAQDDVELVAVPHADHSRSRSSIDDVLDYLKDEEDEALKDAHHDHLVSALGKEPTAEEEQSLRVVADELPLSSFLIAAVELCERSAYYGLTGPFQNYIENKYKDPNGLPGALGLGRSGATALTNFFTFFCYLTPILGAVIADQYLGKYRTIVYFSIIYVAGLITLFATSLPFSIEHGLAFPGLILSMIIIGLGTGGIKSNVSPLIAEQYQNRRRYVKLRKSGERVIVDPAMTTSRIFMVFYLCINIGSLSPLVTTNLESHIGFWAAFLVPLILFGIGFLVLIGGRQAYVVQPPSGSIILHCFTVLRIAIVNGGNLQAAAPSQLALRGKGRPPWNDTFIVELRQTVVACKVFLFFPIYWAVQGQISNNLVSQAGQMQLHSIPNDIMQNIDPITIVIFIPLMDRIIYPFLRNTFHWKLLPITRITLGFIAAAVAMFYAAFVQHRVYSSPPCFSSPKTCTEALDPTTGLYAPNSVHVALQSPAYFFIALSEIFASITGLEYAYSQAPTNMKSFVMSLFLLTTAAGAAFGGLLAPQARDPNMTWLYLGLASACAGAGILFWLVFRKYNKVDEQTQGRGAYVPVADGLDVEPTLRTSRES